MDDCGRLADNRMLTTLRRLLTAPQKKKPADVKSTGNSPGKTDFDGGSGRMPAEDPQDPLELVVIDEWNDNLTAFPGVQPDLHRNAEQIP